MLLSDGYCPPEMIRTRAEHHSIHPATAADRSQASDGVVRARPIDIEIDGFDAALWSRVTVTRVPRSITELNMAHLVQPEASPFATARETGSALSAELVGERYP